MAYLITISDKTKQQVLFGVGSTLNQVVVVANAARSVYPDKMVNIDEFTTDDAGIINLTYIAEQASIRRNHTKEQLLDNGFVVSAVNGNYHFQAPTVAPFHKCHLYITKKKGGFQ